MKGEYQNSSRERKRRQPLNGERLRALALAYVGRYATSCGRLTDYLTRKIAEHGWADESTPPVAEIVAQFQSLDYVNDETFARTRSESLLRRGYGPNRLRIVLHASRIGTDIIDRATQVDDENAFAAAMVFARRKRIGPYTKEEKSPDIRQKMIARLLRAGHSYDIARKILALEASDIESM
ncbi:MAG: RecX family transcriptional regulator [Pseudomonadota bacterium]